MPVGVYLHKSHSTSTETRRKIGLANTGRKRCEEVRRRISEAHQGQRPVPLAFVNALKANTGRPCSPETREKISKANNAGKEVLRFCIPIM